MQAVVHDHSLAAFQRDGFLVLPGVLSAQRIAGHQNGFRNLPRFGTDMNGHRVACLKVPCRPKTGPSPEP